MRNNKLTYLILFLFLFASKSVAGGWNQPKGSGFFKVGQFFLFADKYFDLEGRVTPLTTSGFFSTHIYGEYGIHEKITVGGYVPFLFHTFVNGTRYESGRPDIPPREQTYFGDVDLFVQYGLIQNKSIVLSTSLLLGIPTGNSTGLLTSGDGEFNQMIRVDAGYSASSLPLFAGLSLGFNNRTSNFSDEIRLNAEVGMTFKDRYVLIVKNLNTRSLLNGDVTVVQGGIFSNDVDYSFVGPELLVRNFLGGVGVTANYFFTLAGKNTVANDTFSVGLFLEL